MSFELRYCDQTFMSRALADVIPAVHSLVEIKSAAEEASRLATDAYELSIPAAEALAERLLHTIHVNSSFQAPLAVIPSVVWSTLVQAKMGRAFPLQEDSMFPVKDARDLSAKLTRVVETMGAFRHPFLDDLAVDRKCLNIYAKNWFGSIKGFTWQLGSLMQRCEGPLKLAVLRNLSDEFQGVPHCELRARFLAQAAPEYDNNKAVTDRDRVTSSFALSSYRTAVCLLSDPSYALGTFYVIEAHFPLECKRMLDILRNWGFDELSLEIFNLHVTVDEDHAREWLDVILSHVCPDAFDRVLAGAMAHQNHRRRMFDDMRAHAR